MPGWFDSGYVTMIVLEGEGEGSVFDVPVDRQRQLHGLIRLQIFRREPAAPRTTGIDGFGFCHDISLTDRYGGDFVSQTNGGDIAGVEKRVLRIEFHFGNQDSQPAVGVHDGSACVCLKNVGENLFQQRASQFIIRLEILQEVKRHSGVLHSAIRRVPVQVDGSLAQELREPLQLVFVKAIIKNAHAEHLYGFASEVTGCRNIGSEQVPGWKQTVEVAA